ncbi:MAG: CoA transferase [Candidatus Binatia bacterium]|nr:CoA transferase [Candidatus Binatia bacterium]
MTALPLEGVRVADFGWILAAPQCTAWLGVMGAEVIRIESRQRLDPIRFLGQNPRDLKGPDGSPLFNGLNYSKKSVTLNLNHPRGVELAKEIVRRSDIVVENFTAGMMKRWGLSYEELCRERPDLIMVSGSPLGQYGPDSHSVGWGPITQASAGICHLTGYPDGPPVSLGGTWPDYMVGVVMTYAVLAALYYRRRTGKGQYIDLAMAEVVTAMLPEAVMDYVMNQRDRGRRGNQDDIMVPHNVYRCRGEDTWVAIAVETEEEWRNFCHAVGHPEWIEDERFRDRRSRKAHEQELDQLITAWTRTRDRLDIMQLLQAAGVAATPVYDTESLIADPHFQQWNFLVTPGHPVTGNHPVAGIPGKYSAIDTLRYTPAPCLGQHNEEVFGTLLGLSREEIARLHEEQVIY